VPARLEPTNTLYGQDQVSLYVAPGLIFAVTVTVDTKVYQPYDAYAEVYLTSQSDDLNTKQSMIGSGYVTYEQPLRLNLFQPIPEGSFLTLQVRGNLFGTYTMIEHRLAPNDMAALFTGEPLNVTSS